MDPATQSEATNVEIQKEELNTKEVAHLLGISEQTIYVYVKNKELNPAHTDWTVDGTYYFYREDVEKLKERFEKPGMSTKEAAERLGVTINTVAKYIKQDKLPAVKKMYRGKERYFVTEEELTAFMEGDFSQRDKRQPIFMPGLQYHLYQLFEHKDTKEAGRLLKIDNRTEGWFMTEGGEKIPAAHLAERGFNPVRPIEKAELINKKGYVTFNIPKPHHVTSTIYKLLDLLFITAGAQNIKITEDDSAIKVEVKPFRLTNDMNVSNEEIEMLNRYLVEGKIQNRPGGLLINSMVKSVHAFVTESLKNDLLQLAEQKGLTLEELTVEMLRDGVRRYKEGE